MYMQIYFLPYQMGAYYIRESYLYITWPLNKERVFQRTINENQNNYCKTGLKNENHTA